MGRRFISDLGERETVDETFIAAEKQLRTNRNGNLYLQVRLADRTGSVTGMLWNANERVAEAFDNGDYVRVQASSQLYNGALQFILNKIERVPPDSVDESDFVTVGRDEVEQLTDRLAELLRSLRNVHLRNLAECFLMDEALMAKLTSAPAGVKNHHAYRGGLLQHVVSVMELAQLIAPRYPDLDADVLLCGAFLHDLGKIDELTYERDLGYSDEGQLIGHIVIAVELLSAKAREAEKLTGEPFPQTLLWELKHVILSHHGEYAFGSPKLPMTLEAVALTYLDNLDAKMHSIRQIMAEDVNADSPWTTYHAPLQRKFYKGSLAADAD